jgi:hypothetical protein
MITVWDLLSYSAHLSRNLSRDNGIPPTHVQCTPTVVASPAEVRAGMRMQAEMPIYGSVSATPFSRAIPDGAAWGF